MPVKAIFNDENQERTYHPYVDIVRLLCVISLVLIEFGLPIPYFAYVQVLLYSAIGILFTLYGYLVLRDGTNLLKNIKHTAIVFAIMLVVYGGLTIGYCWFTTGNPWINFTKRKIFEFVVLNYWGTSFCASIWYVQATLYSLIAFFVLKKLKKFDWILCIILFAFGIVVGELSGIIKFNIYGYTYIPGNFLTRTMPYMLLGRLIYKHYDKIMDKIRIHPLLFFLGGIIISAVEFLLLGFTGTLAYANHMIGFIPMSAAACVMCTNTMPNKVANVMSGYALTMYKGLYYAYNPFGYGIVLFLMFICPTTELYSMFVQYVGITVLFIVIAILFGYVFLKKKFDLYEKMSNKIEDEDDLYKNL